MINNVLLFTTLQLITKSNIRNVEQALFVPRNENSKITKISHRCCVISQTYVYHNSHGLIISVNHSDYWKPIIVRTTSSSC